VLVFRVKMMAGEDEVESRNFDTPGRNHEREMKNICEDGGGIKRLSFALFINTILQRPRCTVVPILHDDHNPRTCLSLEARVQTPLDAVSFITSCMPF